MKIKELKTEKEWLDAYQVMRQLRTHLDVFDYLDLVKEAVEVERYHLAALYEGEKIVAVTGFKPMTTLYYGRFVWVCDLVTDEHSRSKGYGEQLLNFVHQWAENYQFESVALSSGLQRHSAHRFYEEKMGYSKASYVLKKTW
ncbi:GNAT family N-acetyltransferase [Oceanobacillus jeddahense]|uniref:GNAT family N-acetyltransferase n=1 Tax=Oceanobacillus jeddahense TaxID=1462527 RepID=UPI000595E2B1|nr:GNAT family N-acetyltransferase [Oceanobacillus jeddahense]